MGTRLSAPPTPRDPNLSGLNDGCPCGDGTKGLLLAEEGIGELEFEVVPCARGLSVEHKEKEKRDIANSPLSHDLTFAKHEAGATQICIDFPPRSLFIPSFISCGKQEKHPAGDHKLCVPTQSGKLIVRANSHKPSLAGTSLTRNRHHSQRRSFTNRCAGYRLAEH